MVIPGLGREQSALKPPKLLAHLSRGPHRTPCQPCAGSGPSANGGRRPAIQPSSLESFPGGPGCPHPQSSSICGHVMPGYVHTAIHTHRVPGRVRCEGLWLWLGVPGRPP